MQSSLLFLVVLLGMVVPTKVTLAGHSQVPEGKTPVAEKKNWSEFAKNFQDCAKAAWPHGVGMNQLGSIERFEGNSTLVILKEGPFLMVSPTGIVGSNLPAEKRDEKTLYKAPNEPPTYVRFEKDREFYPRVFQHPTEEAMERKLALEQQEELRKFPGRDDGLGEFFRKATRRFWKESDGEIKKGPVVSFGEPPLSEADALKGLRAVLSKEVALAKSRWESLINPSPLSVNYSQSAEERRKSEERNDTERTRVMGAYASFRACREVLGTDDGEAQALLRSIDAYRARTQPPIGPGMRGRFTPPSPPPRNFQRGPLGRPIR